MELICTREAGAVFEAGGLQCVLSFIRDAGPLVHKDTLHSAMVVVSRLCSKGSGVIALKFHCYFVE